ncbi:uncharacterized protein [Choristoneura fumiferana]|uniref:uncharacterized protein n=1 Tax=Choristoneura fumiferana TaxID=7141 RepID=UPI003D15DF64
MRWDIILWSFIISLAVGLPSQEPPRPKSRPSCIHMSPEKEEQIDIIVEKLGDFLANLQMEHEHFDIRLIKLAIEQHTADEVEEKETMLQLSVNDCQLNDDELDEIDHHREKARLHELEKERSAQAEKDDNAKKNFEVMYLDLPENGQELVKALDKEHGPKLVYITKDRGLLNYMFLTKKK